MRTDDEGVGLIREPATERQLELRVSRDLAALRHRRGHEQRRVAVDRLRLVFANASGVPAFLVDRDAASGHVEHHAFASGGIGVDEIARSAIGPALDAVAAGVRTRRTRLELSVDLAEATCHGETAHPFELSECIAAGRGEARRGDGCREPGVSVRGAQHGPVDGAALGVGMIRVPDHGRPAQTSSHVFCCVEQPRTDASPAMRREHAEGEFDRGGLLVTLPAEAGPSDHRVAVPCAEERVPAMDVVAVPPEQLGGALCEVVVTPVRSFELEAEGCAGLEVGGIRGSERRGHQDRADIDVHLRGCTLRPAPMRAADQAIGAPIRPQP